ncbi:hypothetical protein [Streptomyces violaceoruber]|nr:hypothetical protein [Streptomyces violaceoruber]
MPDTQLPADMAAYGGILMDTRPWLYADTAADALAPEGDDSGEGHS